MKHLFKFRLRGRLLLSAAIIVGLLLSTAATTSNAAVSQAKPPITIGFSVSLTGDFSDDGQAILQGYKLWMNHVNRPKTAAYVTLDDPFATPEVDTARAALQKAGLKTVYNKLIPAEATDFQPEAIGTAHSKAQIVLIGSPGANLAIAMIHAFIQQH